MASDIKSGKYLKEEYRMQVVFYSFLLQKIQGVLPVKGQIINANNEKLDFDINDLMQRFAEVYYKVQKTIDGEKSSPVVSAQCKECIWRDGCLKESIKNKDLGLITGLGREIRDKLNEMGIKNLKDFIDTDKKDLKDFPNIDNWKLQARAIVEDTEIVRKRPKLPETKTEIFFDVESENELNIDYLYGLLVKKGKKEEYKSFWADSVEGEKELWQNFCEFMKGQDDFTIYYYTSYELQSLKRLKKRYGMDEKLYKNILDNSIDLYGVLIKNIILPVYSYSIKPVARYLGFNWDSKKASGSQSMVWYSEYLKKKDKKIKDVITQYNKDDCMATKVLKDWISNL